MHKKEYEDIIGLPHHVSTVHPQMSIYDRAAQFSPFAALTGHEAAIQETARLTEKQAELNEDKKEELNEKLQELATEQDYRVTTETLLQIIPTIRPSLTDKTREEFEKDIVAYSRF